MVRGRRGQEEPLAPGQRPRRGELDGRRGADPRQLQGRRLLLGRLVGHHGGDLGYRHASVQAPDHGGLRGAGRQDPDPVRDRSDRRRRAPHRADRHLDQGDRRGRCGHAREPRPAEQHQPDGLLGCTRQLDAGPSDRGHPRPGGQPQGRDHAPSDQVLVPRGPDGAGVLHRDPRRPQGPGRHRAAHGELGLPDPSSRRRLPGRHRPRGRLRHGSRPDAAGLRDLGDGSARAGCRGGEHHPRPRAGRGRGRCERRDRGPGGPGPLGRAHQGDLRRRRGRGPRALGADLRLRRRRVRGLLRPLAGDQQAGRHRRGRGHHRGSVDRSPARS